MRRGRRRATERVKVDDGNEETLLRLRFECGSRSGSVLRGRPNIISNTRYL